MTEGSHGEPCFKETNRLGRLFGNMVKEYDENQVDDVDG